MNIAGLSTSGKAAIDRIPHPWLLIGIVVLSSTASFGLGVLEGRQGAIGNGISITELATTTPPDAVNPLLHGGGPAAVGVADVSGAPPSIPAGGEVVASKNGAKYYLPWCGGVKLIKEDNKVWFATREAAEAAGYTPAANCKGL